jgi:SAM-dependent methyltransferase/phage repressor protein C with HTH and peptisase S24 domain
VDVRTLNTYSQNAAGYADRYDAVVGGISDYFPQAFAGSGRILDIGCGSGRGLCTLHELGYFADGVDPCEAFVDHARKRISQYGCTVSVDSLPALSTVEDKAYDAVLCSAVIMHVPEEELFDAAYAIRRVLSEKGCLLLSVPLHDPSVDPEIRRDAEGRLFNGVSPEQLELLFERIGFRLLKRWDSADALGRSHRRWATLYFRLDSSSGSRPIDTIESVLNKDAKVATYKLALFRSLAEIAVTNYKLAGWLQDGKVKVPLVALAEKWIEYYWPIVEARQFIPQTTGRPIAFRKPLEDLVQYYRTRGGLSAFSLEYRNAEMSDDGRRLLNALLSKLKQTIWNQPVRYAGGGEDFSVFQYDKRDKTVLVGSDIWKELSLMGTWIQDATILRWAELTERISENRGNRIKASAVIDCLLTVAITQRDVGAARKFYDTLKDKRCVWSDDAIRNDYDLDHAIPFSLWKNNDLWNLLPAKSTVNGQKSDKLPTRQLVRARKDCIVDYWGRINEAYPARFEYEAEKFIGIGMFDRTNWENRLFSTFAEAIEITAIQRGVERWSVPVSARQAHPQEPSLQIIYSEPDPDDIYTRVVPLYSLQAAAGAFSAVQEVEPEGWVEVDSPRSLRMGMFVAKVVGHSMEPRIPDGSYCLFSSPVVGSRNGRIVLVQHHAIEDPDHGGRYTVKLYESSKRVHSDESQEAWEHEQIVLKPLNPEYENITVSDDLEGLFVIAEFLEVLRR